MSSTLVTVRAGSATALGPIVYQTVFKQAAVIPGPAGPIGPPGGSLPTLTFAYGDASPALIATILAGTRLFSIRVSIETPFNGTGADLSVGTIGNPNLFADAAVMDPSVAAVFEFSPQDLFLVDTPVYLFITPGAGATAGAGSVILQRQ